MGFRANLERLMGERNWTPEHLSAETADRGCQIDVKTIERWLLGAHGPSPANLFILSMVFGQTPDELRADVHEGEGSTDAVMEQGGKA